MYWLSEELWFPPVETATPEGILALGGDLSIERLQLAYKSGIFPWFSEGDPIVWYSPDPRMVLFPDELKISKSMRQILRKEEFTVTFNKNFKDVIENCKVIARKGQAGTWITEEMKAAYIELHKIGWAKSVEVWRLFETSEIGSKQKAQNEKDLIGGLYGVDLGTVFCGESMFSKVSNTSKIAFIYLVEELKKKNYKLVDCQVYNEHLASLGARQISRKEFLKYL
ncbi:MAG: leucyl/phenylalanyl-tRNA--protein transferase [Flavobacteriaceae bacterium]|nr:leucyl/phenylalanyl-tRNA--protein transferase [Flavobacteriaceae bacterium]